MDYCTIYAREKLEKAITKKGRKLIYLLPYSLDVYPWRIYSKNLKIFYVLSRQVIIKS